MTTNERFFQGQPINPKLFPCFVCQKRGFENVLIRLAGKDNQGNPIRVEQFQEVLHRHRGAVQGGSQGQVQTAQTVNDVRILDAIIRVEQKCDTILKYLGADPTNDDGDSSRESPETEP